LSAPRAVSAQEHLADRAQATALCRYASPAPEEAPTKAMRPAGEVVSAGSGRPSAQHPIELASWVEARSAKLLQVYSVDISALAFRLAAYDPRRRLLSVVAPPVFEVFDGAFGVTFEPEAAILYEVDEAVAEEVRAAWVSGALSLRLYFVVASVRAPESPLCLPGADGAQVRLPAQLLATRLWRAPEAGARVATLDAAMVMLEQRLPVATALASVYGLEPFGSPGALPHVSVRQAASPSSADGAPLADPTPLAHDLERLALPCYLHALGQGGPQTAALTVEAVFDGASVTGSFVNVDASGFPPLGACIVEKVRQLVAPEALGPWRVRFTAYFERR